MRHLRRLFARLAALRAAPRADDELREELEAHLEMQVAEYVRRGLPPAEARRRALMESGGLSHAVEAVRAQRGLPFVTALVADVRGALRALRRTPAFTAVAVLTLALGIGANAAIFSAVRGVLLKPLPHRDGERLVYLRQSADGPGSASMSFSVPEIRDLRAGAPSLAAVAEYSTWTLVLRGEDETTRLDVGLVTGNYFDVMGLRPVLGRLTNAGDDGPAAAPVAVLTHEFWQRRHGGDPGVVGRQLSLDGRPVTVIGVLEPAPFFPDRADLLVNMVTSEHHLSAFMVEGRTHRMTELVARLAPGATLAQARREVATVVARMHAAHPEAYDANAHFRVAVLPFRDVLGEQARPMLLLLMAAAAFVMVIAAANVANLTLMRGVHRDHELVMRVALGAGTGRLRRWLLAENLVLALAGAAVGTGIAAAGVQLLAVFVARWSPRADEVRLDGAVLAFTVALAIVVAVLLSLAPALPADGTLAARLASGGRRAVGGRATQRLQRTLVVAQVAVSVVLLAGAGLLTRTMLRLSRVDTGLRTEEVLTLAVPLLSPTQLLKDPGSDVNAKVQYARMRRAAAALPGVLDAGVGSPGPLRSTDVRFDVRADGRVPRAGERVPRADFRTADPAYFRASGIPLVEGRTFTDGDGPGAPRVVVVNRALADLLFPGESPLGRRVAWTGDVLRFTPISPEWRTIVGVVGNTQDGGMDAPPRPAMFMPFAQELAMGGTLVVRADSNVAALVPALRRIVRQVAPGAPVTSVLTVAQIRDQSVAPRRQNAALVSSFGVLATLIAAVGIAGVLAFSVSARTAEIGIRMSLGAGAARVQRMVLREGGVLLALGLAIGVAGAFVAGGLMRGLLFGVAPHDPPTLVAVAALMALVGVAACWIPALRAARVDPVITMRA